MSSNRDVLRTVQIDYPGPGRPGTNLAHEFNTGTFDTAGTLAQLAKRHAQRPDWTMVLSSEMLERVSVEEIACIQRAFVGASQPVKLTVMLIIRNLASLLPSIYAQRVRNGKSTQNFDEFFQATVGEPRLQFFQTASRWAEIFGWSSLRIRVLERKSLLNGDLFDDLLSVLGCGPAPAGNLPLKRPEFSNVAPGWRVIEALRALRRDAHGLPPGHPLVRLRPHENKLRGFGGAAARIGERHGWNNDRGRYLSRQQADICRQIYVSNVEALNQHLPDALPSNPVCTEVPEREYLPGAEHIPARELRAFYDDLAKAFSGARQRKERPKRHLHGLS
ncbi:MAG TPA: hypothetical protein VHY79_18920 [Rhizomicrobium sp.]|nr:hypothetical protein [Rhizomicrobium sp.]